MLLKIENYDRLDGRKLMDLYRESNMENVDYFYPDAEDREEALRKVEGNFLTFLRDDFFAKPGSTYWILEENGVYAAGLRLTEVQDRLFYLEALETDPDYRLRGYSGELFRRVFAALGEDGSFTVCDCVNKRNTASINAHKKAGFTVTSECGMDLLSNESSEREYGMTYRFAR